MILCPFCGAIGRVTADLSAHTRQQCEARILARIRLHQQAIEGERERLSALREATNRDAQVPS